ncbi:MAG: TetR/AcrR family transcriptional regulator [Oscillospiraceae bacterium]|nr:TetR/AcrR family transcriptional regulator [Oscillospiraceae bacterium]
MSKRNDIINAAVREFGEYSYDAASINRIIKVSGTSKGTFYHYFRDKKALYFAIIEDAVKIKQSYFARMMEDVKQEDNDFFDIMKAQAKAGTEFMRENPGLWKFGTQFVKEQSQVKKEFEVKYLPGISDSYIKVVEAGIAGKNFTKRYPPDFISRIIGYVSMNYYDILFDKDEMPTPQTIEQRLDMLFDFLKRGLS